MNGQSERLPAFCAYKRYCVAVMAVMWCTSSFSVWAGPFDDLINEARRAAKSVVDAAAEAVTNAKRGGVPQPAPPAPPNTSAPPGTQKSAPATSVGPPASPAPGTVLSPTEAAPSKPSNWTYRVTGNSHLEPGAGWSRDEGFDYLAFVEHVNQCSSRILSGGGVNELFEQDLIAKIRLRPNYPQMLGKFAVVSAGATEAGATEAPPSDAAASVPAAIKCLAILKTQFPELGKVQFSYFTFKNGKVVGKTAGLNDLLLDGSFDESGQKSFTPSFASEDLIALAANVRQVSPASKPPARVVKVPTGKPMPGLNPVSSALRKTFSVGAYEAVAIKSDGRVEVRSFDPINSFNNFDAKVGSGRVMPGLQEIMGVRAQATYESTRIGTVSAVRDKSGKWMGWRPGGPPVEISFENNLKALRMTEVDAPPAERIVNIAGGRTTLWRLYDDGTVLMTSNSGLLPGTFEVNWQKEHKFRGVTKIIATPGPSGSYRALLLKEDGTVWANGVNFFQGWLQSEGNSTEKRMSPMADTRFSPVRLEGLSQVRDVAAYWPSTAQGKGVALLQDGSVVWFKIALDIRDDALRNLPVTRVTRIAKARAVAAGAWGVGVVDADGKVWVWGSNPEVSTDNRHSMPGFRGGAPYGLNDDDPTMVPGLSEVVDIDFSDAFAGALRSDGTVWVWNDKAPMKIFDDVRLVP